MKSNEMSRRSYLKLMGASAALATSDLSIMGKTESASIRSASPNEADRARRMKWWHEAKFGMFHSLGFVQRLRTPRMGDGK
jgi:alpha-L-fucosidase